MGKKAKYCLVIIGLLFITKVGSSQIVIGLLFGDKLNNDKLKFGLTTGINFGSINNFKNPPRGGLNFGLFMDITINDRIRISPEAYAINETGGLRFSSYAVGDSILDLALGEAKVRREMRYMSLPVLIKIRVIDQFYVSMGPQANLLSRAEDIFTHDHPKGEIRFTKNVIDQMYRIDVGALFGIGYTLLDGKGMCLEARFYQGFLETYKGTDPLGAPGINQWFQASVSIPIGAKAKDDDKD